MVSMRRKLDRCLSAGGFAAIVSAALLTAGPFTVFPTVAHDDVDLPNEALKKVSRPVKRSRGKASS